MEIKNNAAQVIGGIFIGIGIISFIVILASFDWDYYNDIKDLSSLYSDEIAFMKNELLTTWIYALVLMIGNVAAGIVLMTLGKILGVLEFMAFRDKEEPKQDAGIEEVEVAE